MSGYILKLSGYMSSNSRWFLDTQDSSSFKAEHEKKFVLYTIILKFIKIITLMSSRFFVLFNFISFSFNSSQFNSLTVLIQRCFNISLGVVRSLP